MPDGYAQDLLELEYLLPSLLPDKQTRLTLNAATDPQSTGLSPATLEALRLLCNNGKTSNDENISPFTSTLSTKITTAAPQKTSPYPLISQGHKELLSSTPVSLHQSAHLSSQVNHKPSHLSSKNQPIAIQAASQVPTLDTFRKLVYIPPSFRQLNHLPRGDQPLDKNSRSTPRVLYPVQILYPVPPGYAAKAPPLFSKINPQDSSSETNDLITFAPSPERVKWSHPEKNAPPPKPSSTANDLGPLAITPEQPQVSYQKVSSNYYLKSEYRPSTIDWSKRTTTISSKISLPLDCSLKSEVQPSTIPWPTKPTRLSQDLTFSKDSVELKDQPSSIPWPSRPTCSFQNPTPPNHFRVANHLMKSDPSPVGSTQQGSPFTLSPKYPSNLSDMDTVLPTKNVRYTSSELKSFKPLAVTPRTPPSSTLPAEMKLESPTSFIRNSSTALPARTEADITADLKRPLHASSPKAKRHQGPPHVQARLNSVPTGLETRMADLKVDSAPTLEHDAGEHYVEDDEEDDEAAPSTKLKKISNRKRKQDAIAEAYLQEKSLKELKEDVRLSRRVMEDQSARYIVHRVQSQQIISTPREYQTELFERAKERNIIAVLETGIILRRKMISSFSLIIHRFRQDFDCRSIASSHL
jgi:hypothetical protein